MTVSLDAPQRKQIERRRQQTRDYRLAMRLSTVLWRDNGKVDTAGNSVTAVIGLRCRTSRRRSASVRTQITPGGIGKTASSGWRVVGKTRVTSV